MNTRKAASVRQPVLEPLELRALLSGSDCGLMGGSDASTDAPALTASATRVAIPNVVGSYTHGSVTFSVPLVGDKTVDSSLIITSQSGTTIEGKISVSDVGLKKFKVTGTIDRKGRFTINYNKNGLKGTIKGKRAADGTLSGTFNGKIKYVYVYTVTGTFTYPKDA